jgi:RES domain-containing protein
MSKAWRIVKAKHQHQAFTGIGSQFASGRWHNKMAPMVYCSDSQALSALETFVHLQDDGKYIKFVSFELHLPTELIVDVESIAPLPKQWRKQPPGSSTKRIGSEWIKNSTSAVLSVPSAIVPSGRNYLINPGHPDFSKISILKPEPFSFDTRLWK